MMPQRQADGASERRTTKYRKNPRVYCGRKRPKVPECTLRFHHFVCLCVLLTDQTPTPTRFLQNCEEVGLFKEIEEEFLQEQEEEKNKEVHIHLCRAEKIKQCKERHTRWSNSLSNLSANSTPKYLSEYNNSLFSLNAFLKWIIKYYLPSKPLPTCRRDPIRCAKCQRDADLQPFASALSKKKTQFDCFIIIKWTACSGQVNSEPYSFNCGDVQWLWFVFL